MSPVCVFTKSLDVGNLEDEPSLAMLGLAQKLAAAGRPVTLVWMANDPPEPERLAKLQDHYLTVHRIALNCITQSETLIWQIRNPQFRSFKVRDYLQRNRFSAAIVPIEEGLPYYTLMAKETGVFAAETAIHVVASAPIAWRGQVDKFFFGDLDQVKVAFMERYCAGHADRLLVASRDLLGWMEALSSDLCPDRAVVPPLAPMSWDSEVFPPQPKHLPASREVVPIFGTRFRDGLSLLCDVLDSFGELDETGLDLTFAGPFFKVLGEHSGGLILRRARRWRHRIRFARDHGLRDAVRYARDVGAVVLIADTGNVGGYIVRECIRLGVPYVATAVGGNADETGETSARHSLAPANPRALARLLADKLASRKTSLPALSDDAKLKRWTAALARPIAARKMASAGARRAGTKKPLVSVIVVHHDRPQFLLQAMASIYDQDYPAIEVVLVDDGSALPESHEALRSLEKEFKRRRWKLIRAKNKYVGAARNAGVRASKGEYVIFVDDDNAFLPGAITTYVAALQKSGADVCTALSRNFYGAHVPGSSRFNYVGYLPLGGALDVALVENCIGDTMAIYRRSVFDKVGYQLEKFGYMVEDYEFFVRVCLKGLKIRLIPEPLFWYRVSTQGRYRSSHYHDNMTPILKAFANAKYQGLEDIYSLVIGQNKPSYEKESYRTNLSYSPSDRNFQKLAELKSNSDEAIRLLARIAAEESRLEVAVGLLSSLGASELQKRIVGEIDQRDAAEEALRQASSATRLRKAIGLADLRLMECHGLSADGEIATAYVEEPGKLFLEAKGGQTVFAVLPAGCPDMTLAASCAVSLAETATEPAEALLLHLPMHDDPAVAVAGEQDPGGEGCSGWVRIEGAGREVRLEARQASPTMGPRNLILAIRAAGGGHAARLACFQSLEVETALANRSAHRPRLGAPPTSRRAGGWTDSERRRAKLVTNYASALPMLLLPKPHDGGIFLRPAKEGPVVAEIEKGFPPFARQLLARVEIAHDEASPFEFAVALTLPTTPVEWRAGGPKSPVAFSGWVRVEERFKLHDILVKVMEAHAIPLTISLAVRLPAGSSPAPANAFFRSISFLWDE